MKDTPVQQSSTVADPSVTIADDSTAVHGHPNIVLRRRDSLNAQAIKAVAVFIGFYVLALVTVLALVLAPFFVIGSLGVFSPYIVISCYGVALLIVLAIIP